MSTKRILSRVPGLVETYKLAKNLRYLVRSQLSTSGGIRGGGMSCDEAVAYVRTIFEKVDRVVQRDGGWTGMRWRRRSTRRCELN